ncbi:hypothetical protein G6F42_017714 [Rhizopus arrhizus]|nr:hypothetical protein G6F42_017714 [Rhizopus arrhizus]
MTTTTILNQRMTMMLAITLAHLAGFIVLKLVSRSFRIMEKARKAEGREGDQESEEDSEAPDDGGEDQIMAETDDKKEGSKDIGDIYQKLNELVDMFQRMLKGKDDKA